MITKIFFETRAVPCLLAQSGLQPPLRTLAMRIANAARLLDGLKVECQMPKVRL